MKKKITFFLTLIMLMTSVIIMVLSTVSAAYYMTRQARDLAKAQLGTIVSSYDDTLKQYGDLAMATFAECQKQPQLCGCGKRAEPSLCL